ncbi:MAG: 4Fe-4S dicluster domain-containing protein [Deltaproteobacteria bacterium]|nr:MAG: 4Fe-4S dicluster domain-containing protein [Deltaproteobacteria bacterium]
MSTTKPFGSTYWRSLEALAGDPRATRFAEGEFLEGASELPADGVSRRRFMGILGASAALAGATATTGCVRKPVEHIVPFAKRPEYMIPGRPLYYATAFALGGSVQGLLVESQDGRPTKIEGNPRHPGSQGATTAWAQASVLDLYDPERSRTVLSGGGESDFAAFEAALAEIREKAKASGGANLAVVVRSPDSPTMRAQLAAFRSAFGRARIVVDEPAGPAAAIAAAEAIGGKGARVRRHLDGAAVVAAFDADFLGTEPDTVRLAKEWSRSRRVQGPADDPSRLYVVEPHFTSTGMVADHRRAVRGALVGPMLVALARELAQKHAGAVQFPSGVDALLGRLPVAELDEGSRRFIEVLAKDLAANKERSAVLVGIRQPAWVHGLAYLVDHALRNVGKSLRWHQVDADLEYGDLEDLAKALSDGAVDTVVCLGTNPAYDAPGSLGLAALLEKATVVHAGLYVDDTALLADWHVPVSHDLEAWGDLESSEGAITICQPLIAPLFETKSVLELAGLLATGNLVDGYSLVKGHWMSKLGGAFSDRAWRKWLHDGLVTGVPRPPRTLPPTRDWGKIAELARDAALPSDGVEVNVHVDPKLFDGRYANNAWLQELPHPMSKLVWDNAAYLSVRTAEELGVANGDMVEITVDGRSVEMPVWIAPGQADGTISVNLGYGHKGYGVVARDTGFDVGPLRAPGAWFAPAQVSRTGGTYKLVSTQDHGTMVPERHLGIDFPERPIALEMTHEEYEADPNRVEKVNLIPKERLKHLWTPPELTGKQQWGMVVDLGLCTGCSACVVACQAENNIPVVGKQQVGNAREMHWMRIDRYYRGDVHEPTAIVQPMMCQHCEAAPCETVCPVAATTHSPEGLNDMAYNRCIGTRYCSNNCPFKVRRFNFFNYNLDIDPLQQMQKNPDVTVRFRGVMEKCTYCVQRIQEAKIAAHAKGEDIVPDGTIVTACQQACPTDAIVFGDVKDPSTRVSKLKAEPRNYAVLRDLNVHPRTTYLARIRNPHPELA